jgi:L-ascorbate metabolism protein UlaG (beta-lactamase superfamily)
MNILVDPIFSGFASPLPFLIKAFPGSDVYHPEDMPPIDLLIITHNHYDHLDTRTLSLLATRIKKCVAPLGVAHTLAGCGIPEQNIAEMDWWQEQQIEEIGVVATPSRHFSGRGLKRGGSLWCSFALTIGSYKIFVGGDSGYDSHFAEIGTRFDCFDLAVLECGQYSRYWPFIHMMPEETVQAAIDLHAKCLLPVHWGKFALASHPWSEPVQKVVASAAEKGMRISTPMIGEPVILDKDYPVSHWWDD